MGIKQDFMVVHSRLTNFDTRLKALEASTVSVDLKPILAELAELSAMFGALQAVKAPVKAARPVKTPKKEDAQ